VLGQHENTRKVLPSGEFTYDPTGSNFEIGGIYMKSGEFTFAPESKQPLKARSGIETRV
jgi:hypothetical protein